MRISSTLSLLACFLILIAANIKPGYELGDVVKDFKLKNTDGKDVSLAADFKNSKGVILIFDCNTCPYSKGYNERVIALNKKYASKGFPLVTINANDPAKSPGDSFEEMKTYAKSHKYDFPYLFDKTQQVARAFGATNTPQVYILLKNENDFKIAYIGAIDNNARDASAADKKYVEEAVDACLKGKLFQQQKRKL